MRLHPSLSLLLLPLRFAAGQNATDAECNCDGCPDSNTVYVGTHEDMVSPVCLEGSVATVTALRSIADSGKYQAVTWNTGSYSEEVSLSKPYVYRQASMLDDTKCFEADPTVLPVVGDQTEIKVMLNCESAKCDFRWDVQFGCAETGVTDSENGGLQVLSDVDDTITCSNPPTTCDSFASCTTEGPEALKAYLAGKDRRLEHKEMYPGVAELMLGLALGKNDGNGGQYYPAKPIMLSARPREAEVMLAIDQDSELNIYLESTRERVDHAHWGVNVDSSLYGTIFDGTDFKEFGQTKAKHYNDLTEDKPTTNFAFLGDNGQGDLCAAQSMLDSDAGNRTVAILMQVVQNRADETTECESPEGTDFTLDLPEGYKDKVHYFETYSDAALWSYQKGLISCCSASNVHYVVNEWHACRCLGDCPAEGLPTGFSELATRDETLAYCDALEADQVPLAEAVASCDPSGSCSSPMAYVAPAGASAAGSIASGVGAGVVLGTVFGLLLA